MPISIRWDDEQQKSLIIMQFEPDWFWGEFQRAVLNMLSLRNTVSHPVDVIFDLSANEPFTEFDGMTHVWWLIRQCRKAPSGYYVLVTHDPILRVVANVVRQSQADVRGWIRVANDMPDARAMLDHKRRR